MKEKISPKDFKKFYSDVQLGKTGIRALDMMPPERRIRITQMAFDSLNKNENILSEKNFTLTSNAEAESNMRYLANRSNEEFSYKNPAYGVGYVNKNILDAQQNVVEGTTTQTPPGMSEKINRAVKYGALDFDSLVEMKNAGDIGDEDFLAASEAIYGYQTKNRQLPEFKDAIELIVSSNPHIVDEYGQVTSVNEKQGYLLKKLDEFADKRELSGQEIRDYVGEIMKEADTSFNGNNNYTKKFTKDKFYNMFSIKYEDISSVASKYIIGNTMNRSKIKQDVMAKYQITSEKANALLSYWLNIRKLEGVNAE
jgi:hypothetical protein